MALIQIEWHPTPKKIRQFGGLLTLFLLMIAWRTSMHGHPRAAISIAVVAAIAGAITMAAPAVGLLFYQAWMAIAFIIGTVVTALMLFVLYFGIITPLSLIFRLIGRDALSLKKTNSESYWVTLNIPEDKQYFERLS